MSESPAILVSLDTWRDMASNKDARRYGKTATTAAQLNQERVDVQLIRSGVPPKTIERWEYEMQRCETMQACQLTAECHRIEAMLYARYA